jgi:hypothetical protein
VRLQNHCRLSNCAISAIDVSAKVQALYAEGNFIMNSQNALLILLIQLQVSDFHNFIGDFNNMSCQSMEDILKSLNDTRISKFLDLSNSTSMHILY